MTTILRTVSALVLLGFGFVLGIATMEWALAADEPPETDTLGNIAIVDAAWQSYEDAV